MAKYRKKPVVIEAFRFGDVEAPDWWRSAPDVSINVSGDRLFAAIPTLEGVMTAEEGDWIIKGVKGEIYPCKHDIFEKTYERVEEEAGV